MYETEPKTSLLKLAEDTVLATLFTVHTEPLTEPRGPANKYRSSRTTEEENDHARKK